MNNDKFKLIKSDKTIFGKKLFQIVALKDFGNISKGELGGYVEKEENISVSGDAWVYGNARVSGDARVYGDASVCGEARVYGSARVSGNAWVYGEARVYGSARVYGDASVYGNAWVYGEFKLSIGLCFGRKRSEWDVSEIKNGEEILLIRDYKKSELKEAEELTLEQVCKELGREIKVIS